MSLRLRLVAVFSLATALAVTFAGVVFAHQLRDNLNDALDSGLRARLGENIADLSNGGGVDLLRHREQVILVQNLDGTVVAATPAASPLRLTPQQRARALAGEAVFTADVAGARTRILVSTASLGSGRALVAVGTATDIADDAIDRVRAALWALGPIAVAAAVVAAWVLAGAALGPVERMRREAAAISEYEPERRLRVPSSRDEVAALATTMNKLLDRRHVVLARDRQFMADAGHELRTPLAILRADLELGARPGRSPQALHAAIVEARHETDRLIRLAEDLLLLTRSDNHQPILRRRPPPLSELLATASRRGHGCPDRLEVLWTHIGCSKRSATCSKCHQAQPIRHSPPGTPVKLTATLDNTGP